MVLDVYTSLVAISLVAWLGGLVASTLHLPRIVPMILLGIVIFPSLHPSIFQTGISPPGYDFTASGGAQNPASSIRAMALLIALIRGGLSVKVTFLKDFAIATALLATVPYFFEVATEAFLAPYLLADFYKDAPPLAAWESASIWAPLSPSIVIPNMLRFVEDGLTEAGRVVLTGAPLEVSTALITEGVLDGILSAQTEGKNGNVVLGHIVTFIFGSILYGIAFALAFACYARARAHVRVIALAGPPDKTEHLLVFVMTALLCYSTSIDSVVVPWLIGFFACLCYAIATQYLLPSMADVFTVQLKSAWYFAEGYLFVLTGCVIRPAIDDSPSSLSSALFGNLFGLLFIGSLARMCGDVFVGVAWQWTLTKISPILWSKAIWKDVLRRIAFLWMATMPKATLQGTFGSKVAKTFQAAATRNPTYLGPADFVAPAAAVSILYCATIGSLLTFTIGKSLAAYFQEQTIAASSSIDAGETQEAEWGLLAHYDDEKKQATQS